MAICKARGWLREAYRVAGSKPLGSWPAALTRRVMAAGARSSAPAGTVTRLRCRFSSVTCQPSGKGWGRSRLRISRVTGASLWPLLAMVMRTASGSSRIKVAFSSCWRSLRPVSADRLSRVCCCRWASSASNTMRRKPWCMEVRPAALMPPTAVMTGRADMVLPRMMTNRSILGPRIAFAYQCRRRSCNGILPLAHPHADHLLIKGATEPL